MDFKLGYCSGKGIYFILVIVIYFLILFRYCELSKDRTEILKLSFIPLLFFFLLMLIYAVFNGVFSPGGAESYLVPIGFWIVIQKTVITITYEKNNKLQESLRMMGVYDISYWSSYFISEGIIIGFLTSFLCAIASTDYLFNNGGFGHVLGLLLCVSELQLIFPPI